MKYTRNLELYNEMVNKLNTTFLHIKIIIEFLYIKSDLPV